LTLGREALRAPELGRFLTMPILPFKSRKLNKDQLADLIFLWAKEKNKLPRYELIDLGFKLGYSFTKILRLIDDSPKTKYYRNLIQVLQDT